jgi:peptidyl-prolyl cis-trans isomerase B (cyclophilin B)
VPTNKQRRQAAQRHLQRQLERRTELAKKRRRNLGILASALAVLVVVGAALLITGVFKGDDDASAAADPSTSSSAPASSAAAPVVNADGTVTCGYTAETSGDPNAAAALPADNVPGAGTRAVTMTTNFGAIGLTLDQSKAPCATGAIVHLAQQGFFDNTNCHRETNSPGLQVLQCGDPTGTGGGGAGFKYPTQVTHTETYPRGTVAMANANQGTDGSQFFLVYGDSLEGNPNYTIGGTIDEAGLSVLDTIAAKGIAGGATDGAPAEPVTITAMTVAS